MMGKNVYGAGKTALQLKNLEPTVKFDGGHVMAWGRMTVSEA